MKNAKKDKNILKYQSEIDIPEALDFAILEYASKKRYVKHSKFIWTLRIAAAVAVAFVCTFFLNNQTVDNSDEVIQTPVVVASTTNEYDEFTSALAQLNESFNKQFEEVSESVENELTTELVLISFL